MEPDPSQTARRVGLITVGGILLALGVFLLITWLQGDRTDDLEERQPSPSPSSAALIVVAPR